MMVGGSPLMATKLKKKDTFAFLHDYSVDDLKQALTGVVAELAQEYSVLHDAQVSPQPFADTDKRLLGTRREDLTTVDLTSWRIAFWEGAQDRLWNWYRIKSGQATGSDGQGGSPLE
jgi:hypothetical protein